ncbi:MAG TPA: hydrogenase maturation nickel metallochaperone HypA [Bacteroidales bacterium]|nr:hydrogenase maturation nickel metallochaperone HypA [Bacteroidales bacterium]
MHELSVVQNIINIVSLELERNGGSRVSEVKLEIGRLSGIEFGSLDFALKHLTRGSIIESAEISVEKPEGVARCNECHNEFKMDDFIGCCNLCNSVNLEIIKGRELRVKSITIE